MRKFSFLGLLAVMMLFFYGCSKPVATVNGKPVTERELDRELERAGGKNMLETLISQKLVEQDAAAKHISVSDQEVEKQIEELKKTLGPTEQQNLTGDKLKMIRDNIRFNILLRKTITASVSEADKKAYFEKNKDVLPEVELSAIVVADEKQAQAIEQELKRGKDFASLSREFSIDPMGRERGGYVGFASKGNLAQLSPSLAQAAFSLKPGEVSGIVKTPKGFYILKIASMRDTYDQLRDEVERQIASDRAKGYLDDLRAKAKVAYKGEYADH